MASDVLVADPKPGFDHEAPSRSPTNRNSTRNIAGVAPPPRYGWAASIHHRNPQEEPMSSTFPRDPAEIADASVEATGDANLHDTRALWRIHANTNNVRPESTSHYTG